MATPTETTDIIRALSEKINAPNTHYIVRARWVDDAGETVSTDPILSAVNPRLRMCAGDIVVFMLGAVEAHKPPATTLVVYTKRTGAGPDGTLGTLTVDQALSVCGYFNRA